MLIFTSVISIFIYFKPQVNIPLTQQVTPAYTVSTQNSKFLQDTNIFLASLFPMSTR